MRRITGTLALLLGLTALGFTYAAFTASAKEANVATTASADAAQIERGAEIYQTSCITCHGANLQGELDRGPSLVGVGQAAAYFQLSTGRMPATEQGAQMSRKEPYFTPAQIDDLSAFIQANGGGPQIPGTGLRDESQVAMGGELFRLNCASCHNFTGQGGALSQGKYAPSLNQSTDEEIWGAMLSGPENMPKFGDGQLTPAEKAAIVAYIQNNKATIEPGGLPLGGFGPAPEGLIAFLVGMGAIVAATLWMGSRA
ncbi:MAG TPA: cytochrome c [Nakamurella sp.]|jgi:ubiquinol-cytochrome c reductase cytochrome c subunit